MIQITLTKMRRLIKAITFFAFLLCGSSILHTCLAVDSSPDISNFGRPAFRIFNDNNGLPQNSINCMTFDQKGYLWIGTNDGAAYYNGHKWNIINMPNRTVSNYIHTLKPGSDGSIWFGTYGGGLVRLKNGQWTTFDTKSGLPNNTVWRLLESSA